jgi:hypothetical protein
MNQGWDPCETCGAPQCCGHGLGPTRLHYLQAIIRGDAENPYFQEPELPCCKGNAWGGHTSSCVRVSGAIQTVRDLQAEFSLSEAVDMVLPYLLPSEQEMMKRRLKL